MKQARPGELAIEASEVVGRRNVYDLAAFRTQLSLQAAFPGEDLRPLEPAAEAEQLVAPAVEAPAVPVNPVAMQAVQAGLSGIDQIRATVAQESQVARKVA